MAVSHNFFMDNNDDLHNAHKLSSKYMTEVLFVKESKELKSPCKLSDHLQANTDIKFSKVH